MNDQHPPRRTFRALTRRRGGYDGAIMVDVQLQVATTGALVWSRSFSDEEQADAFRTELDDDLESLDDGEFRRKYSVPTTA